MVRRPRAHVSRKRNKGQEKVSHGTDPPSIGRLREKVVDMQTWTDLRAICGHFVSPGSLFRATDGMAQEPFVGDRTICTLLVEFHVRRLGYIRFRSYSLCRYVFDVRNAFRRSGDYVQALAYPHSASDVFHHRSTSGLQQRSDGHEALVIPIRLWSTVGLDI